MFVKVSDDALEEEAREYVYSVHIEGDEPVEGYSFQKHDSEAETVDKEPAFEESSVLIQDSGTTVQEAMPAAEKPVGELPKLTYASIVCTIAIHASKRLIDKKICDWFASHCQFPAYVTWISYKLVMCYTI